MKVKATGEFKRLGVWPVELNGYIPEEGYEFDVSGERYEILKGNNTYHSVFVKAIEKVREPVEVVETATKKQATRTTAKKTTKKAK